MWFLIAGVLLLLLKLADLGPVAQWSWLLILAPFGLAALWWGVTDAMGLPQKRAMRRMEARKTERREKSLVALGLDPHRDRKVRQVRDTARRATSDPVSAAADVKAAAALDPTRREPQL